MLNIKNLKQRRFSKKMSHKYVKFFRVKNKIDAQTYRFILFNIYRIHNIFHVSLLKNYHYKKDDKYAKQLTQISKLIDDKKQWKIEKILDKMNDKKDIWYKIKWFNWNSKYNQWLHKNEFKNASNLMKKYNERASRKRKRRYWFKIILFQRQQWFDFFVLSSKTIKTMNSLNINIWSRTKKINKFQTSNTKNLWTKKKTFTHRIFILNRNQKRSNRINRNLTNSKNSKNSKNLFN